MNLRNKINWYFPFSIPLNRITNENDRAHDDNSISLRVNDQFIKNTLALHCTESKCSLSVWPYFNSQLHSAHIISFCSEIYNIFHPFFIHQTLSLYFMSLPGIVAVAFVQVKHLQVLYGIRMICVWVVAPQNTTIAKSKSNRFDAK